MQIAEVDGSVSLHKQVAINLISTSLTNLIFLLFDYRFVL